MFRTIGDRPSKWELALPAEVLRLPEELARADVLLDDPAFYAPFAACFHPVLERPSTPVECYLRLMLLKSRYRLGYGSPGLLQPPLDLSGDKRLQLRDLDVQLPAVAF